jgi:hypothetical protein
VEVRVATNCGARRSAVLGVVYNAHVFRQVGKVHAMGSKVAGWRDIYQYTHEENGYGLTFSNNC